MRRALPFLLAALVVAGGCGPKPIYRTEPIEAAPPAKSPDLAEPAPRPSTEMEKTLADAANSWIGVPYRYGGVSRQGVDCSALAAHLLEEVGVKLPRSVNQQRNVGREIPFDTIEAGDLVFFKIESPRVNHVGVVLDRTRFVHASRSRGVAVDLLENDYFRKRIVQTRRVLNLVEDKGS
jgi:lipoprotein Spr/probable lipoprotein NlpC